MWNQNSKQEERERKKTNSFDLHSETNQTPYHKDGRLDTVKTPLISCAPPSTPSPRFKDKANWLDLASVLQAVVRICPLYPPIQIFELSLWNTIFKIPTSRWYFCLLFPSYDFFSASLSFRSVCSLFFLSSRRKHTQHPGRKKDTSINIVIVKMVSSQLAMQFSVVSRRHGGPVVCEDCELRRFWKKPEIDKTKLRCFHFRVWILRIMLKSKSGI